jgi:hypothetical protein
MVMVMVMVIVIILVVACGYPSSIPLNILDNNSCQWKPPLQIQE